MEGIDNKYLRGQIMMTSNRPLVDIEDLLILYMLKALFGYY